MSRLQQPSRSRHIPATRPVARAPEAANVVLDHTSPKLDVHSKIKLFPHQQALVHKIIEMETRPRTETFVGVLKDPPGSGKSYPLLSIILHEKRMFGRTQNLLVIPHNIHEQWLSYIENFSDELTAKSLMYYGDITRLHFDARALFKYDILITTSTFYPMITETILSLRAWFNRVILDEIDSISFFTNDKIPSQCVWLVSASADLTKTGAYKDMSDKNVITCDPLFIKRSINLQPPLLEYHKCYNMYVELIQNGVQSLKNSLGSIYAVDFTPFRFQYLRNEKIDSPKAILSAVFRDDCLAYHSVLDTLANLEEGASCYTQLAESYETALAQKTALESEIAHIVKITQNKICPMCCDIFDGKLKQSRITCCNITVCTPCIEKWKGQSVKCPKCAGSLEDKTVEISPEIATIDKEAAKDTKDKMQEFEDILKKEIARDDFRILIFSDHGGTFMQVHDILRKYELKYAEIAGNQFTMNKSISDYKTGKRPILIVDSQSYGAGMNMHMTSAVIIFHKTQREEQMVGRAQRLGRTTQLHVHHLLYEGE